MKTHEVVIVARGHGKTTRFISDEIFIGDKCDRVFTGTLLECTREKKRLESYGFPHAMRVVPIRSEHED